MSSGIVDLMLMHGKVQGLFSFSLSDFRKNYADVGFSTPYWLPLYEISRRNWDTSIELNKIGGSDDFSSLYAELKTHDVEFYRTEEEFFSVEAFLGWGLTQSDFETRDVDVEEEVVGPDDKYIEEDPVFNPFESMAVF